MAAPVWSVGQVLTASDVNVWFVPIAVTKPTSQSVTSSTALVNDSALAVAVAANANYEFTCQLFFIAANGPGDIKWTWSVPAGSALIYQNLHNEGGGTGVNNSGVANSDADTPFAAGGGSPTEAARMTGNLNTSATTGNIQLRWAQNTSSATATQVRANSQLILRRIG
jgi:hypothetical protein